MLNDLFARKVKPAQMRQKMMAEGIWKRGRGRGRERERERIHLGPILARTRTKITAPAV